MEKPKLYQCPLCLLLYVGAFLLAVLTRSLFGCLAALAIMFVAHLLYEEVFLARAQRKHAIRQVSATLVDRRQEIRRGYRWYYTSTAYYATFATADGDAIELEVTAEQYAALPKVKRGELCYQGWKFLAFRREENHAG